MAAIVSQSIGDTLGPFSQEDWTSIAQILGLSPRELQIICHVFDDQKEAGIAVSLGISPHTVRAHLARIYGKLGVASRVQLMLKIFAVHLDQLTRADQSPTDDFCVAAPDTGDESHFAADS